MKRRWQRLNTAIRGWWDGDLVTAHEADIRADDAGTLLFLPYPYSPAAGNLGAYPELYGWDTYFINLGLLIHDRSDIVRNHILNQISMIERFGMVLNGNRTFYRTRSQPPLLADGVWRYFQHTGDRAMLHRTYAALKHEFERYWNDDHHRTPIGLTTNRDAGDPSLRAQLAAEAETGLDFTAIFGGDVRECVPLITNCILVRYAAVMRLIAAEIGQEEEIARWDSQVDTRTRLINAFCWDEAHGFFFEYNFVRGEQLTFKSLNAYWALWAGITTGEQTSSLVKNLPWFEYDHGLVLTDRVYDVPHPEFTALQWSYPVGWPPFQIMIAEALLRAGFEAEAKRVSEGFLRLLLDEYDRTGHLWEKYNVVDGNLIMPRERADSKPFHGWTSAAVVVLGTMLYGN